MDKVSTGFCTIGWWSCFEMQCAEGVLSSGEPETGPCCMTMHLHTMLCWSKIIWHNIVWKSFSILDTVRICHHVTTGCLPNWRRWLEGTTMPTSSSWWLRWMLLSMQFRKLSGLLQWPDILSDSENASQLTALILSVTELQRNLRDVDILVEDLH